MLAPREVGLDNCRFQQGDASGLNDFTVDATVHRAKVGKVRVSGPRKVEKRRKATYKVRITNSGNAKAAGVKLRVKGKGVKARKSVGKIPAGKVKNRQSQVQIQEAGQGQGVLQGDFEERRRQDREEEDQSQEVGWPTCGFPRVTASGQAIPAPVFGRLHEKGSGSLL